MKMNKEYKEYKEYNNKEKGFGKSV